MTEGDAQAVQVLQAPAQSTGHAGNVHGCVTGDVGHALPLYMAADVTVKESVWIASDAGPQVAEGDEHVDQPDQVPAQSRGAHAGIWQVDVCTKPCANGQAAPEPTAEVDTEYVAEDEPDTPQEAEAAQAVAVPNAPSQSTGHTARLHCCVLVWPSAAGHAKPPLREAWETEYTAVLVPPAPQVALLGPAQGEKAPHAP